MILELDAGNTRIKWRLLDQSGEAVVKVAEGFVLAKRRAPSVFIDLDLQLDQLPFDKISTVKISSVREEGFKSVFSMWMTEKWQAQPEFVEVQKTCAGLTLSYDDVGKLGVDRWLAMLAAYKKSKRACCIVDCGSAITVDIVNDAGQHQGGYIVPGFCLMKEALSRKAPVLDSSSNLWQSTALANNTQDAVHNGILSMVLGLLERVERESQGMEIDWYVTGGDAGLIAPLVTWDHQLVPDLVMDGLAISMV